MADVTIAELSKSVPLYTSALSQLHLEVGRLRDDAEQSELQRAHAANGTAAAHRSTATAVAGRRRGGVLSALATVGQGYAWLEARAEREAELTAARVAGYAGLQANLSLVSTEVELLSPEKEHRQRLTLHSTPTPTLYPYPYPYPYP